MPYQMNLLSHIQEIDKLSKQLQGLTITSSRTNLKYKYNQHNQHNQHNQYNQYNQYNRTIEEVDEDDLSYVTTLNRTISHKKDDNLQIK